MTGWRLGFGLFPAELVEPARRFVRYGLGSFDRVRGYAGGSSASIQYVGTLSRFGRFSFRTGGYFCLRGGGGGWFWSRLGFSK